VPVIFGLNLPNYSSLGNCESMIAIAERAEQLGYSSLWTSDHILIPSNLPPALRSQPHRGSA
jgi:alkanesulfonate monooxygenase SsuD/methylene tetrahydromethanopterin reductase-like flavin-dependent oxidoreductase (luciferase family)